MANVTRTVDLSIYSKESIRAASAAFEELCGIEIAYGSDRVTITIDANLDGERFRNLFLGFWNFALDCESKERLSNDDF